MIGLAATVWRDRTLWMLPSESVTTAWWMKFDVPSMGSSTMFVRSVRTLSRS